MPYFAEGGGAADDVKAMTEEAMAMRFSGSSNIAQRFANALVQAFSLLFEQAEEKLMSGECEAVQAWVESRRHLGADEYGSHARCFDMQMYTDDPHLTVVGIGRTVRAIKLWH